MALHIPTESSLDIEAEAIRFYSECPNEYLAGEPWGIRPYLEWRLGELLREAGSAPLLLDIGCGTGRLAQYASHLGAHRYLGIDTSAPLLAIARQAYPYPGYEFRRANILSLSESVPERADVCVSCYVLSHISRDRLNQALRQIRAVMRLGGTGVLEFIYGDKEIVATREDIPSLPEGYRVGLTYWTEETLGPYLAPAGFELIEEEHNEGPLAIVVRAV